MPEITDADLDAIATKHTTSYRCHEDGAECCSECEQHRPCDTSRLIVALRDARERLAAAEAVSEGQET